MQRTVNMNDKKSQLLSRETLRNQILKVFTRQSFQTRIRFQSVDTEVFSFSLRMREAPFGFKSRGCKYYSLSFIFRTKKLAYF